MVVAVKTPTEIVKRDGRIVPFDDRNICWAFERCFISIGQPEGIDLEDLTHRVVNVVSVDGEVPTVEKVQDSAIFVLQSSGHFDAAEHYIIYRHEHAKKRASEKIPDNVLEAFKEDKRYFPTELQRWQFYDKYSRYQDELGRRETWKETVNRTIHFLWELMEKQNPDIRSTKLIDITKEIRRAIMDMRVMPSMRLMAMAGDAARRNNAVIYNCSFLPIDSIDSLCELMSNSMAGCGVGYSVEFVHTDKFTKIPKQKRVIPYLYVVDDSAEGWVDALRFGLSAWFQGCDVDFDFSKIRPKGSVLRTKGGRASGPEPLRALLSFIRERILGKQGKKLTTLDCHDIACAIGNAVVSGGVRRTALICLFDEDDEDLLHCKDGDFAVDNNQRWNANNSAVWTNIEGMNQQEFVSRMWTMFSSERGEPGIFSRETAVKMMPVRRSRNNEGRLLGTNPCAEVNLRPFQFCVSGDTNLITRDGIIDIKSAVGKRIEVWNGNNWANVVPFKTGINQKLVRVNFGDGSYLDCTPDHRFSAKTKNMCDWKEVTAKELLSLGKYYEVTNIEPTTIIYNDGIAVPINIAYDLGFVIGDGHIEKSSNGNKSVKAYLYGEKALLPLSGNVGTTTLERGYNVTRTYMSFSHLEDKVVTRIRKNITELFTWNRESILTFVAGWLDADGSETGTGGIRLYISNEQQARLTQLLLTKCGIRSSVNLLQKRGALTNYGPRSQDLWYLQITDARNIPCKRLNVSNGHTPKCKGKYQSVRSVVSIDGLHNTYCFEEPKNHMGVFNNVLTYQCNLTDVVARADDTLETLSEKVRIATIIGTIQSTATYFPNLRSIWKVNCEAERLLGVGISGQLDSPLKHHPEWFSTLQQVAYNTNKEYASLLGINQSAAITCVKPSGNSSVLLDSSSGLHARWAPFYIRNVRISAYSPLVPVLRDSGYDLVPENGQDINNPNTYVVSFPVKTPEGAVVRDKWSALEQCEWWLKNKVNWTEHNPSVTIYYDKNEIIDLLSWLWEHRTYISGMSFLPKSDAKYDQLPYIEITEQAYNEMKENQKPIQFERLFLYEKSDYSTASQELACDGSICELPIR